MSRRLDEDGSLFWMNHSFPRFSDWGTMWDARIQIICWAFLVLFLFFFEFQDLKQSRGYARIPNSVLQQCGRANQKTSPLDPLGAWERILPSISGYTMGMLYYWRHPITQSRHFFVVVQVVICDDLCFPGWIWKFPPNGGKMMLCWP